MTAALADAALVDGRRVYVVTGGTAGIGRAACVGIAAADPQAHVVVTGRDEKRGAAVVAALDGRATFIQLDLERFSSTRAFAADVRARFPRVHALVHNAGVVYPRRIITEDGHEAQLQVIHLAPFLLTQLLDDVVTGTIVNVVSDLHRGAPQRPELLDDWSSEKTWGVVGSVGSVRAYQRAELLKVCWTYALARRLEGRGVVVNCVHPGGVRTRIYRNFRGPLAWLMFVSDALKKSPASGAKGVVHLATAGGLPTGRYFVPGLFGGPAKETPSSFQSRDTALQERVWIESERRVAAARTGS